MHQGSQRIMSGKAVFTPGRALASLCLALLLALLVQGCARHETLVSTGNKQQILHRGIGHELADLDPQTATMASDYHVLSALFEGLVSEDPVDLHPVPGVAEGWDITGNGTIYTFRLRPSAKWSQGSPVVAQDFVDSYRRALSPSLAADNASQLYVLRGAEAYHKGKTSDFSSVGVEAVDTHTLRLTLEHPTPWFLGMLSQAVWFPLHLPAIAAQGPIDRRGNRWARPGTFVGNGPFVLKDWSVNHRIILTKSPTYWDREKVRLSQIHFYPLEPDTEERAFRAGQLHVTEALPPGKTDHYRATTPTPLRVDPLLGTYFYRLNVRNPALADSRVRQALSLALGRQAITAQILRGVQIPATSFTPPGIPGYTPPTLIHDDPQAARRLLSEAGFPGGAGFPTLNLLYNSSETHRLIAEAVQESWRRELGIHVRLSNMDNASVLAARRAGDFQILRSSWTGDFADAQNFLGIWSSSSNNNFTGWADTRFDSLLEEASACTNPEKRAELLKAAESRLLEEAPCIPIYTYAHVYLIQPSVHGWYPTLLDHHPYKNVWLEP